jgi:hypothetical protein
MDCATKLTEGLRGLVREEELRDLWELLHAQIQSMFDRVLVQYGRELKRLGPSSN